MWNLGLFYIINAARNEKENYLNDFFIVDFYFRREVEKLNSLM